MIIRAPLGDKVYWEGRVSKFQSALREDIETLGTPSRNPAYAPQFWFDHSKYSLRMAMLRYSCGDAIPTLAQHFEGLLDAWELSNRLSDEICKENKLATCRDWTFDLSNLNHYNWCFWLVGLALTLEIPAEQWQRLVALIGGEGQDVLLDRVITTRQPERKIGATLLHHKPYARLLAAVDAPKYLQANLLRDFVDHWYTELARKGKEELWWYIYGDAIKHPLEMGSYFGRWCIEAAVVAKVFAIDDSLCLGHEHYPGDLLRPDSPSTHSLEEEEEPKQGFFAKIFGKK